MSGRIWCGQQTLSTCIEDKMVCVGHNALTNSIQEVRSSISHLQS